MCGTCDDHHHLPHPRPSKPSPIFWIQMQRFSITSTSKTRNSNRGTKTMPLVDTTIQIEGEANHTHPREHTHTPSSRGSSEERVWKWRETSKTTRPYSHLRRERPIHIWGNSIQLLFHNLQFAMLDVEDHKLFHAQWMKFIHFHPY
jgi:hypothetical protein